MARAGACEEPEVPKDNGFTEEEEGEQLDELPEDSVT